MANFLRDIRSTGEFDGKSVGDISKMITRLRNVPKRTAEQTRKLRAANFAKRAKRGEFSRGR